MMDVKTQASPPAATWATSVRYLKGVGPEKEKVLRRLEIATLRDLFYWFPRRHEARFPVKKSAELIFEGKECVSGVITSRGIVRFGGRSLFKAVVAGEPGTPPVYAVFYNQPYLIQVFKPKSHVVLYGTAEKKGKRIEMVHPEYEIFSETPGPTAHHGRLVPIYPLTEDLTQKSIRQTLFDALHKHSAVIAESLPVPLLKKYKFAGLREALTQIHFPDSETSHARAYRRLVFEEFFRMQLDIEGRRARLRRERPEIAHAMDSEDIDRFIASLPFDPTGGQMDAIRDIRKDMASPRPMNRLVQGDVGSGKTLVAAAALFTTVRSGFQGALMAPTEVLAQQLYLNIEQLLEPFGVRAGYLAQSVPAEQRAPLYRAVEEGAVSVVVGTHALLDAKLRFKKLGLAVVDEQHKFGVAQRSGLRQKGGSHCHSLVMTATPIPRTLAMTLYGDMDISVINEKPKGRQPVKTLCYAETHRPAVYRWMEDLLKEGSQVYIVCPSIEERAAASRQNVEHAAERVRSRFPGVEIAVLHGQMKAAQKNEIMDSFRSGSARILVSTTVIEVGVDVPAARFILIENADAFGLAQLHQLRGRVGRDEGESFCVLMSDTENPESIERLEAFTAAASGFEIAEKDLERRGSGEQAGRRQHGFLKLRIGDPARDADLLKAAKQEARAIAERHK